MITEGQKMIEIESETYTAKKGEEIHSVTLRINDLSVELSVFNDKCGYVSDGTIRIHNLRDGEVTIFADKVSKKKKSRNGVTWVKIKEASQ